PRPTRWWRYGALAAGVGLVAARVSGVGLAVGPTDDGQHLGYDPGHDGASWLLATTAFAAEDHGKGNASSGGKSASAGSSGDHGKGGDSGGGAVNPGAKQAARPQDVARPPEAAKQADPPRGSSGSGDKHGGDDGSKDINAHQNGGDQGRAG